MNRSLSLTLSAFLALGCCDLLAAPQTTIGIWDTPEAVVENAVKPDTSPEGGTLRLGALGAFDNFNPFSPRGVPAALSFLTYETLGESIGKDDFVMRGLLAESVDIADDRLSMVVKLREEASFSDGSPVRADDVLWTFNALMKDASPTYRNYYREITGAEVLDPLRIRFTFKNAENRELPLILLQLPVLSKQNAEKVNLGEPAREPLIASGPYVYADWTMGASLTLKKNPDWWGKSLAQNRGLYKFEQIRSDYFRDFTVMREAFFAGNLDFFNEKTVKDWKLAYDLPAVRSGEIKRAEIPNDDVWGMTGVFMNTRRPLLADRRVREAISLLFNFERVNKTIFFDSYHRITSFWTGSKRYAATDPMTDEEKTLLESLPGIEADNYLRLPSIPVHSANHTDRRIVRQAVRLLNKAGWTLQNGRMTNSSGETLQLTLILRTPSLQRAFSAWSSDLARIGVTLRLQPLDQTQYFNRLRNFDFDLALSTVRQSVNPGNEQRHFFSSRAADEANTRNYAGIKSPAVDRLIEMIASPESRAKQTTAVRVLDRLLRTDTYVVPGWYSTEGRIAWWSTKIAPPDGQLKDPDAVNVFTWHSLETK